MYISTSWCVNEPTPNFTFKKQFRMKTSPNLYIKPLTCDDDLNISGVSTH